MPTALRERLLRFADALEALHDGLSYRRGLRSLLREAAAALSPPETPAGEVCAKCGGIESEGAEAAIASMRDRLLNVSQSWRMAAVLSPRPKANAYNQCSEDIDAILAALPVREAVALPRAEGNEP